MRRPPMSSRAHFRNRLHPRCARVRMWRARCRMRHGCSQERRPWSTARPGSTTPRWNAGSGVWEEGCWGSGFGWATWSVCWPSTPLATSLRYTAGDRYLHAAPMFHLADGASTYAVTWVGGTHLFVRPSAQRRWLPRSNAPPRRASRIDRSDRGRGWPGRASGPTSSPTAAADCRGLPACSPCKPGRACGPMVRKARRLADGVPEWRLAGLRSPSESSNGQ